MTRIAFEPAYLLHHRPYRESSALLEVFSASRGRVGIVARGARAPKSRWRSLFQPFRRLLLSWTERGELGTLSGAEADGPPLALPGPAVFTGWYVNELVLRVLARHDPHPALFEAYAATLAALAQLVEPAPALRRFEMVLLEQVGYGLQWPDAPDPAAWFEYDADGGVRPCARHPGAVRGRSLIDLAEGRLESAQTLRDARRLLRDALAPHLGATPLHTPRVLRALHALEAEDLDGTEKPALA